MLARPGTHGWEVCLVRARRYWGLPKGHVEAGESPPETALREISEECGVPRSALTVVAELRPSEYVYRGGGRLNFKLVHQFLVTTSAGTEVVPQPGEIDEAAWLGLDDARATASFDDTRAAIDEARPVLESLGG